MCYIDARGTIALSNILNLGMYVHYCVVHNPELGDFYGGIPILFFSGPVVGAVCGAQSSKTAYHAYRPAVSTPYCTV